MKTVATKYQLIQLGLCFFIVDNAKNKSSSFTKQYSAHPFNIYLFPKKDSDTSNIVFDMGTMDFHKNQKFDFNKWIYESIPYNCSKTEQKTNKKPKPPENGTDDLKLSKQDTLKIEKIFKDIKNWIKSGAKTEYHLDGLNSYLRKYMYHKLGNFFPSITYTTKDLGKFEKRFILKVNNFEASLKDVKSHDELKESILKSGAQKIFKLLTDLKVPIVGHNPALDLMFMYSHLYGDVPDNFSEFKSDIHNLFPVVYDTMIIFSDKEIKKLLLDKKSSTLESIYSSLSKIPEMANVDIHIESSYNYSHSVHYHEAGYDAYIAGYCFVKMQGYLDKSEFAKYSNKLYAHKAPFSINIAGEESLHENVLLIIVHRPQYMWVKLQMEKRWKEFMRN